MGEAIVDILIEKLESALMRFARQRETCSREVMSAIKDYNEDIRYLLSHVDATEFSKIRQLATEYSDFNEKLVAEVKTQDCTKWFGEFRLSPVAVIERDRHLISLLLQTLICVRRILHIERARLDSGYPAELIFRGEELANMHRRWFESRVEMSITPTAIYIWLNDCRAYFYQTNQETTTTNPPTPVDFDFGPSYFFPIIQNVLSHLKMT